MASTSQRQSGLDKKPRCSDRRNPSFFNWSLNEIHSNVVSCVFHVVSCLSRGVLFKPLRRCLVEATKSLLSWKNTFCCCMQSMEECMLSLYMQRTRATSNGYMQRTHRKSKRCCCIRVREECMLLVASTSQRRGSFH